MGVDIREYQAVTDFIMRGDRVSGVRTATESIEADAVVSTVYSWTNILLSRLGIQLPVKTVVHQRYITEPLPQPISIPVVNADPLGGYLRPAAGGRLLLGIETAEREEIRVTDPGYHLRELEQHTDRRFSPETLKAQIRSDFTSYLPLLANVNWEMDKVGLLTFSMDGEPILGPVKSVQGLYVGVAFHSGGFAYNPVSGLLLSDFVADGITSIDVKAFSPDRFNKADTATYLAETVKQKDVSRRRH
jgi:sarcosine oxidase subunit beta